MYESRKLQLRTGVSIHDLVRHLEQQGCELLREGGNHSVYVNRKKQKTSTVPRHREINDHLAKKICHDLEVQEPQYVSEPTIDGRALCQFLGQSTAPKAWSISLIACFLWVGAVFDEATLPEFIMALADD